MGKIKRLVKNKDIQFDNNWLIKTACECGQLQIVKYLVSRGANIHTQCNYAINIASDGGHLELVKYLVSMGARIESKSDSALIWACINNQVEVAKYLISIGTDVTIRNHAAINYSLMGCSPITGIIVGLVQSEMNKYVLLLLLNQKRLLMYQRRVIDKDLLAFIFIKLNKYQEHYEFYHRLIKNKIYDKLMQK